MKNYFKNLWRAILGRPSLRLRTHQLDADRILFLYLDGQPISRISKVTGLTPRKVMNAIKRHHVLKAKDGGMAPNPRL